MVSKLLDDFKNIWVVICEFAVVLTPNGRYSCDYNWKLNFSQLTESIKKQKKKKKELNDRLNINRSFRGFSFGRSVKFFGLFLQKVTFA